MKLCVLCQDDAGGRTTTSPALAAASREAAAAGGHAPTVSSTVNRAEYMQFLRAGANAPLDQC